MRVYYHEHTDKDSSDLPKCPSARGHNNETKQDIVSIGFPKASLTL